MLALLEDIVNIDGGSYDKAGVDAVGGAHPQIPRGATGSPARPSPNEQFGDALRATVGGPSNRAIMLMGHRDTVFPKGEPTRRPFKIENGKAYGPGVADMKAGLVMNAFVLAAFKKFGGAPAPLVGLFTSDEEIGSPACRPIIEAEARRARAVFNSEPGRPSGNVVTGRKGGVFMKMEVTGKAAHSGGNFADGISAIEELARKTIALHAITDLTKGTTVNVGLDLRRADRQHRRALGEVRDRPALRHAAGPRGRDGQDRAHRRDRERAGHAAPSSRSPASSSRWSRAPDDKRLFEHYAACANDLDLKVEGEFTGGCADSGFTAGVGTPTICAVGPVGGKAHTPEEYHGGGHARPARADAGAGGRPVDLSGLPLAISHL